MVTILLSDGNNNISVGGSVRSPVQFLDSSLLLVGGGEKLNDFKPFLLIL